MRYIYFLLILICCMSARAEGASRQIAERFVKLLRYEVQFEEARRQCLATYKTVAPEALIERNRDYFNGIRPGDRRWPDVSAAYSAYFEQACARPTQKEFLDALALSYAQTLSVSQLQEAIAFYTSPTGEALVSAHKQAASSVYRAWTEAHSKHLADITARFQREITRLVESK